MAEMETDKKVLSFHRLHRKSPETRINAGFPSSIYPCVIIFIPDDAKIVIL